MGSTEQKIKPKDSGSLEQLMKSKKESLKIPDLKGTKI